MNSLVEHIGGMDGNGKKQIILSASSSKRDGVALHSLSSRGLAELVEGRVSKLQLVAHLSPKEKKELRGLVRQSSFSVSDVPAPSADLGDSPARQVYTITRGRASRGRFLQLVHDLWYHPLSHLELR